VTEETWGLWGRMVVGVTVAYILLRALLLVFPAIP
jgi:hypothetical protein